MRASKRSAAPTRDNNMHELELRLRASLDARAADVPAAPLAFDPQRRHGPLAGVPTTRSYSLVDGRRARGAWLGAAAILVAVAVVGAWVIRDGSSLSTDTVVPATDAPTSTGTTATPPKHGPTALVPGWVPDGFELRDVDPRQVAVRTNQSALVQYLQPVGGRDGRWVILEIGPAGKPSVGQQDGVIHGQPATLADAMFFGDLTVEWIEHGSLVTATVTGLSREAAIELLNTLTWAADRSAGMAAVGDHGWRLLRDIEPTARLRGLRASFTHAGQFAYTIDTGTVTGPFGYGGMRLTGTELPDGVLSFVDRSRPQAPRVTVTWPDGRFAQVEPAPDVLDENTLLRIASSVRLADDAELRRLRGLISSRAVALPTAATASLPSGTVEVKGTTEPFALCLTVPGHDPVCAYESLPDSLALGFEVGGRPYAVAAKPAVEGTSHMFVDARVLRRHPVRPEAWTASPTESATNGSWAVLLTSPPPGLTGSIGVMSSTGAGNSVTWVTPGIGA